MKLAILSDIHGNYEALQAVIQDMEHCGIDVAFSLGDLIGYGPDPEAVIQTIRDREIETVLGNHELGAIDPSQMTWFNLPARESLKMTIGMLSKASLAFIGSLETSMVRFGCRFVHGFPPDSVKTYAFAVTDNRARLLFNEMAETVCFIGHTHFLETIDFDGRNLTRKPLVRGITPLSADHRYIVNIGSVGQPRDGNHDAKYAIYDTGRRTVELRYVPYDIETVIHKIKACGLPHSHAERLR